MTITMEIDAKNDLVVRKIAGRFTMDDMLQANEETVRHPLFRPGMNAIWDLRQTEVSQFSPRDLVSLARFLSKQKAWRGTNYKLALVAPKEIDFIVLSTFSIIGQIEELPIQVQVFRNYKAALNWCVADAHMAKKAAL